MKIHFIWLVACIAALVGGFTLAPAKVTEITKEVPKEVIKEVPKEIIKEVTKEVIKEVPAPLTKAEKYRDDFFISYIDSKIELSSSRLISDIKTVQVNVAASKNGGLSEDAKSNIKEVIELELRRSGVKIADKGVDATLTLSVDSFLGKSDNSCNFVINLKLSKPIPIATGVDSIVFKSHLLDVWEHGGTYGHCTKINFDNEVKQYARDSIVKFLNDYLKAKNNE